MLSRNWVSEMMGKVLESELMKLEMTNVSLGLHRRRLV